MQCIRWSRLHRPPRPARLPRALPTLLLAVAPLATPLRTAAGDPTPARPYHLFRPAPATALRELEADRPDQTESPQTVDAGHFQLEMDFANLLLDDNHGEDRQVEIWSVAPMNLKAGLWDSADLQLVLDPFVHARVEDQHGHKLEEASGFGNVQTRFKYNLWGNDGGATALAVMPFVKWPLPESGLRNGHWEGGVIVPFGVALPRGWDLTLMTEFDWVRREEASDYDTWFVNSAALGRDLFRRVGAYVEFFSIVSSAGEFDWSGQVGTGLTYSLGPNTRLDVGCNFGVTESAPDFNPFIGLTWRH